MHKTHSIHDEGTTRDRNKHQSKNKSINIHRGEGGYLLGTTQGQVVGKHNVINQYYDGTGIGASSTPTCYTHYTCYTCISLEHPLYSQPFLRGLLPLSS